MEKRTRYLSLDVSTKTGFAVIDTEEATGEHPVATLVEHGVLKLPHKVNDYGEYPWSYINAAREMAKMLTDKVAAAQPDVIVVEETNLGRQRYTQKMLEFLHNALLTRLNAYPETYGKLTPPVFYLSTSKWRSALGLVMSKDDKKNNRLLKVARNAAAAVSTGKVDVEAKPDAKALAAAKKNLGVKGKVTPKHLALRYVNTTFGLNLKVAQNDEADAICLIMAFIAGAEKCTGND